VSRKGRQGLLKVPADFSGLEKKTRSKKEKSSKKKKSFKTGLRGVNSHGI